jgi:hypothetical protein
MFLGITYSLPPL